MLAVGYYQSLPISDPASLQDIEVPKPVPGPGDLLVSVRAVSVNPVDTKIRKRTASTDGTPKILGYDVAGVVEAIGSEVTLFKPGDEIYSSCSALRPGTNAEYVLIDERIVGRKPKSLSFTQAAALPLTSVTAWEMLFERMTLAAGRATTNRTLLVIGGAGGVGSMMIQFARKLRLSGIKVIATASRPESREWCLKLGAHAVIDHSKPISEELAAIGLQYVDFIASMTGTSQHWDEIAKIIAPQGKIALIDDLTGPLDIQKLKQRSVSLHWEYMSTRINFETSDMHIQGRILGDVADLVDAGILMTTFRHEMGPINAENLRKAHAAIESGRTIGKIVLTGF